MMVSSDQVDRIRTGCHGDPFAVLGVHADTSGWLWLRTFQPAAAQVHVLSPDGERVLGALEQRHGDGFFEGPFPVGTPRDDYRMRVRWEDGNTSILDDPYRFPPLLGEAALWQLGEDAHLRPCEVLGATHRVMQGVAGTGFVVWAPNASRVSVVGDFNFWDGRRHPMRLHGECGVWEIFLPGIGSGAPYKYEVRTRDGQVLPLKADPYALLAELRPATASVISHLPPSAPPSSERARANAPDGPISIYEVHLGSWRRKVEQGDRFLNWDEFADTLLPYAVEMGFTHLELLPVAEHPDDSSWGYQPVSLYAPTSRFGDGPGFRRFVDRCHAAGLGVLLDWAPAHFPTEAHGPAHFDGTCLYENEGTAPLQGAAEDGCGPAYDVGRTEVRDFLLGNALFWLERYDVDGLRIGAAPTLPHGERNGAPHPQATRFLRRVNEVIRGQRAQAITVADAAPAMSSDSQPTMEDGLGFHYRWNTAWMHDTLAYIARDPVHRRYHHDELTTGIGRAFGQNFVLPIPHDQVVHRNGSLLARMPGERWQRFANLRAYCGFMFGHPGKKLLFMGCEFAQAAGWNHDQSLDWHLLQYREHQGVQRLLKDLNTLYRNTPALYQRDFVPGGLEWIDRHDAEHSVLSFIRHGDQARHMVVVVCNFTPLVRQGYRIGVPREGRYGVLLNTDAAHYGGSDHHAPLADLDSQRVPWHDKPHSLELTLPPLATVMFAWQSPSPTAKP